MADRYEERAREQYKIDIALDHIDAIADRWAEEIDLIQWIKNIVQTGRLNRSAPDAVREKFIARQEALIDAFVRQTFLEAYYRGGCDAFDARRDQDAWYGIDDPEHPAPRDGTRFLAVVDGLVRIVSWGKTSHVPLYGFCLADQGPEEYDLCQPTHHRPLPAPPLSGRKG